MTTTSGLTTTPTLSSKATTATQAAAQNAATSGAGTSAIGKLTSNYQTFLKLLMTQLQNQDPTSPMDTNQFTSELVQFSSVEQQINTNTSLTSLIELTQAGQVIQSSAMVGHRVLVSSDQIPLQNGAASLQFSAKGGETTTIAIYAPNGSHLGDSVVDAVAGTNTWSWNGKDAGGAQLPDGAYRAAITSVDSSGKSTSVPFDAIGTATGVEKSGSTLKLDMGKLSVDFAAVKSVLN